MEPGDRRRKALFALALSVLIAWGVAVALLGSGAVAGPEGGAGAGARSTVTMPAGRRALTRVRTGAAGRALEFLAAYLRYERGASGAADRRTLARLSTPAFGSQLLREPVGMPAAGAPPPEWVSRPMGVRVAIFDGRQALLVGVVVVGTGGSHVLTPTLVWAVGGWVVAGIGE
ncbi:MAG TPA: hypothetical protein VHA80_01095 [Solirubrobacterales bacterium]|nr:hypothetical protein [Solirubrobacterales bacterium]